MVYIFYDNDKAYVRNHNSKLITVLEISFEEALDLSLELGINFEYQLYWDSDEFDYMKVKSVLGKYGIYANSERDVRYAIKVLGAYNRERSNWDCKV